jgi:hypothetical protein
MYHSSQTCLIVAILGGCTPSELECGRSGGEPVLNVTAVFTNRMPSISAPAPTFTSPATCQKMFLARAYREESPFCSRLAQRYSLYDEDVIGAICK